VPDGALRDDGIVQPDLRDDELWDRVRELPPKQRTAVVLRYVVDLTHADIADALGSTEEAARRNVHEGIKKLKGALA
jgi:RNA polymerase sigma factor (sigma-70 family)